MSKQVLISSSAIKSMHHRDLVMYRFGSPQLISFSRLKTHRRDTKPVKVWQRPRVLPFDPISELTKPAAQDSFLESSMQKKKAKEEEKKDRGCLFGETRLRSTTRRNPPLAKRPTLHVAYLRKTDGHTREGPPRIAVTRRVSLSQKSRKEGSETRESLGRRCRGGGRAEFLRDRGRATRHRHVCIFM